MYFIQYIFLRSQNICHDATSPIHLQNYGHLSSSTGSLSLSYGFSTHEFTSFSGASSCPSTYKIFQDTIMGYVRKNIFITSFPLTSYTIVISHCSLSCPRLLSSNKKSQSVMNCSCMHGIDEEPRKIIPLYTVVGEGILGVSVQKNSIFLIFSEMYNVKLQRLVISPVLCLSHTFSDQTRCSYL